MLLNFTDYRLKLRIADDRYVFGAMLLQAIEPLDGFVGNFSHLIDVPLLRLQKLGQILKLRHVLQQCLNSQVLDWA